MSYPVFVHKINLILFNFILWISFLLHMWIDSTLSLLHLLYHGAHNDRASCGGLLDSRGTPDFSPSVCSVSHMTQGPTLVSSGSLPLPLRHTLLISQGQLCIGFFILISLCYTTLNRRFLLFDIIVIFSNFKSHSWNLK